MSVLCAFLLGVFLQIMDGCFFLFIHSEHLFHLAGGLRFSLWRSLLQEGFPWPFLCLLRCMLFHHRLQPPVRGHALAPAACAFLMEGSLCGSPCCGPPRFSSAPAFRVPPHPRTLGGGVLSGQQASPAHPTPSAVFSPVRTAGMVFALIFLLEFLAYFLCLQECLARCTRHFPVGFRH